MLPRLWLLGALSSLTGCSESTRDIAIQAQQNSTRALFISIAVPVLSGLALLVLVTRRKKKKEDDWNGPSTF